MYCSDNITVIYWTLNEGHKNEKDTKYNNSNSKNNNKKSIPTEVVGQVQDDSDTVIQFTEQQTDL